MTLILVTDYLTNISKYYHFDHVIKHKNLLMKYFTFVFILNLQKSSMHFTVTAHLELHVVSSCHTRQHRSMPHGFR